MNSGRSPFARQMIQHREAIRSKANEAMKQHIGTAVTMVGKRKNISVAIDRNSVKHIANDMAIGAIDLSVEDVARLPSLIENAKQCAYSESDKQGRHKKAKKVNDFRYHKFTHNGKNYYANVMMAKTIENGKQKSVYRLHDITKKIKT